MVVETKGKVISELESETRLRRAVAIISWIIILFIPTYSKTVTGNNFGPITEKLYMFPWMILSLHTPSERYNASQYSVIGVPWSFVLFIPFFYAFKQTWEMYHSDENILIKSGYTALSALGQLFLIGMTFRSQELSGHGGPTEDITIYYIPQIMLIILHIGYSFRLFNKQTKNAIEEAQRKRKAKQLNQ